MNWTILISLLISANYVAHIRCDETNADEHVRIFFKYLNDRQGFDNFIILTIIFVYRFIDWKLTGLHGHRTGWCSFAGILDFRGRIDCRWSDYQWSSMEHRWWFVIIFLFVQKFQLESFIIKRPKNTTPLKCDKYNCTW